MLAGWRSASTIAGIPAATGPSSAASATLPQPARSRSGDWRFAARAAPPSPSRAASTEDAPTASRPTATRTAMRDRRSETPASPHPAPTTASPRTVEHPTPWRGASV